MRQRPAGVSLDSCRFLNFASGHGILVIAWHNSRNNAANRFREAQPPTNYAAHVVSTHKSLFEDGALGSNSVSEADVFS